MSRNKFVIAPHMRLHEWVAEEKGYFEDEGLEYAQRGRTSAQRGRTSVSLCLQKNCGHISGVIGG